MHTSFNFRDIYNMHIAKLERCGFIQEFGQEGLGFIFSKLSSVSRKNCPSQNFPLYSPRLTKLPITIALWYNLESCNVFLPMGQQKIKKLSYTIYEPMLPLKVRIFRKDNNETRRAVGYLNSILRCDMITYQDISVPLSKNGPFLRHSTYMRNKCKERGIDCSKPSVFSSICKSSNFHIVKLLRLGLVWAKSVLSDPNLDTKIVYLARDPRATIRSRKSLGWCNKSAKDCSDPATVCQHMLQDLRDARELRKAFPNKV
ncbi:unnamed protein product [Meganyctiphanes norvegica]|uniref:Sulfotransferase n=1 Tax=Meganyctiphanes norvegica TaxID=48144 RepID=A0AAV2SB41_MEGNR